MEIIPMHLYFIRANKTACSYSYHNNNNNKKKYAHHSEPTNCYCCLHFVCSWEMCALMKNACVREYEEQIAEKKKILRHDDKRHSI